MKYFEIDMKGGKVSTSTNLEEEGKQYWDQFLGDILEYAEKMKKEQKMKKNRKSKKQK